MTKTSTKVQVTEVTEGMMVKGNMISGFHTVATIKIVGTQGMGNGVAAEYELYNADGQMFFVGRVNSKATLAA